MVTCGRYGQPLFAIRAFQAQTYSHRELVVVDDNSDHRLADEIARLGDARIRVVRPPSPGLSLGNLRNLAVAAARGSHICIWDDDDLHDRQRLEVQMRVLIESRASACLLAQIVIWWPLEKRVALSGRRLWEMSLLCDKRVMPSYPDLRRAEDTVLVEELRARVPIAWLNMPRLYCYVMHARNTWSDDNFEEFWKNAERQSAGEDYRMLLSDLAGRLSTAEYEQILSAERRKDPADPVRTSDGSIAMSRGSHAGGNHTTRVAEGEDRPIARLDAAAPDRWMPIPPPKFLFLQVNKRCNLRCQHCDFWQLDDSDKHNYLSPSRKREVIGEFCAMNPQGAVVICGGESMLDLEDYFSIPIECRRLGLKSLSVVNGTRIRDDRLADRMILEGPDEISISLNSHREALHDETRGVRGAFRKAVQALRLLLEARRRHPDRTTRIYVMGLIFDQNYRELDGFYDFVLNDIGADKLKLNFLQPAFGQLGPLDPFFAAHGRLDPDELGRVIDACNARYRLNLNPVWRRQVVMYFRSLQLSNELERGWGARTGTLEHICNTYERNIMVDHYGVARLCFAPDFPGTRLRGPGDLAQFWNEADPVRTAMQRCNRYCGISHSVRREHSTVHEHVPV
jgi:sulfatase maturation enzyme AslB (radical SAM superfamily)